MSIASVAQDLYTIQSKKNVSFKTAASILLREELAARFSVYNIVKIVTKSSLLATIAQAKYGKPTPEQKKQQEEEKKDKDRSVLFQRYTLSSIANLNRRVGLLANIVDRNNQLISNLYNEIGHYRGARRISPQMLSSPKSIRVPTLNKTIKGKLDALSEEVAALKKIRQIRKMGALPKAPKKPKKKDAAEESGFIDSLIPKLLANPRLAMMLAGPAGRAVSLGSYAAQIATLLAAPAAISRTASRLSGKPGFEATAGDKSLQSLGLPDTEQYSQAIDPFILGGAAFTTAGLGTFIGKKIYDRYKPDDKTRRIKAINKMTADYRAQGMGYREAQMAAGAKAKRYSKFAQVKKWKVIGPLLRGAAKAVPGLAAADIAFEISRMSGYVADNSTGKMNDEEFRKNMVGSYAELISTVGVGGLSTALGGIVGTAALGPLGTMLGIAGGGLVGLIASLAVEEEDLNGLAERLFDLIHKDKTPPSKPTAAQPPTTQTPESTPRRGGPGSRRGVTISDNAKSQVAAAPVLKTSRPLLEFIGSVESKGNYNAVNYTATQLGYPTSIDLTSKTLAEILALQSQMIQDGAASSALGKYQFLRDTLSEEANSMGLDLTNTKFDPATQDKIIEHRLNRFRGMDAYRKGLITPVQFAKQLSMEFASFPNPETGKSYYEGVAGNKSLIALNDVYKVIGARESEIDPRVRLAQAPPELPPRAQVVEQPPAAPVAEPVKEENTETAITASAAAIAASKLSTAVASMGSRLNQMEKRSKPEEPYYVTNPDPSLEEYRLA